MTDWTQGICRGDPDSMYDTDPAQVAYNRRVCAACPIRQQCLERAVELQDEWGMWGGLTPRERRRMFRTKRSRPEVVWLVTAGVERLGALTWPERAELLRQHIAGGGNTGDFARRYRVSGTDMRKLRNATTNQLDLAA